MLITKRKRSAGFYFSNTSKTVILIGAMESTKIVLIVFLIFLSGKIADLFYYLLAG